MKPALAKIPPSTVAKVVSLPSAVVTKTALIIDPRATDKQLGELGVSLVAIDVSRSWWLGDYGLFLQERKRAELRKALKEKRAEEKKPFTDEDEASITTQGTSYLADKSEILGIDVGTLTNYVSVSRFFQVLTRCENLGIAHHIVAMGAARAVKGDVKVAVKWLLKAEEEGWSVSRLREAVNRSLATSNAPKLPPEENPFAPLDEADKWAHSMASQTINPDAARKLLTRFAELIAFVDKLKELAK